MKPSQKYSLEVRVQLWIDGAKRCFFCDKDLPKPGTKSGRATHFDHVIAQARGGSDDLENLVVCCKRCNTEKGDREYIEFLRNRVQQAQKQVNRLNQLIVAFYSKQV